ncbi:hypothetical protein IGI04_029587, partial [Brassica rapa subsp. trilocularis]
DKNTEVLIVLAHFDWSVYYPKRLVEFTLCLCLLRLSLIDALTSAARFDKVYLTVALPDAKDISVKCEPQGLFTFSALGAQGKLFEFSLELYGKVVPEERYKLEPYIKVDWNKWCDEDEEFVDEDCESSDDDGLLKFQQP